MSWEQEQFLVLRKPPPFSSKITDYCLPMSRYKIPLLGHSTRK